MNQIERDEEIVIDVGRIVKALLRNHLRILVAAATGMAAAFLLALLITPKYQTAVTFYVRNSTSDPFGSITSGDVAASKELVDSCQVILQSEEVLDMVLHYTQSTRTRQQLREMITASAVNGTEFLRVEVTSQDPMEAKQLADAIGSILPLRITGLLNGATAKVADAVPIPTEPKDSGYALLILGGFLLGLTASVLAFSIQAVTEKTIRCRGDVEKYVDYPILGSIAQKDHALSGSYKELVTRLLQRLPAEKKGMILGITAPRQGEGNTTAAVDLACCLRRRGKRVILVDCDLLASRLAGWQNLPAAPGLADFLAGKCTLDQTIRPCYPKKKNLRFPVIPAGKKYLQGTELLLTKRMPIALGALRKSCDYVILDLPAVNKVSETAELSRLTDGLLLTVRRDKSNGEALRATAEKLEFMGASILGVIYGNAEPEKW